MREFGVNLVENVEATSRNITIPVTQLDFLQYAGRDRGSSRGAVDKAGSERTCKFPSRQEAETGVSWLTWSRLNTLTAPAPAAAVWRAKTAAVSFCKTRRYWLTSIHVPQFVRSSNHTTWFRWKSANAIASQASTFFRTFISLPFFLLVSHCEWLMRKPV